MATSRRVFDGLIAAAILAAAAVVFSGGCERAKVREADVTAGDYYGEDEIAALEPERAETYCRDLETIKTRTQEEFDAKSQELAKLNETIAAARARRDQLDRELLANEAEIRTLNDQIAEIKKLPIEWRIRVGDDLKDIAALTQVYDDSLKWWRLFEANKNILLDPHYCLADTTIVIPRDWPAE
jgi:nucleoid-associated protein YgaU